MPLLPGTDSRIQLGEGLALVAPGVRGRAERHDARGPDGGLRAAQVANASEAMRGALADAEVVSLHVVDLAVDGVDRDPATQGGTRSGGMRSSSGEPAMVLEVPDLGPEIGQVVLAVDEHGATSWVFPSLTPDGTPEPTTRGTGGVLRFPIRTTVPPATADQDEPATRGLLGMVGRKVLEVLAWRVAGELVELSAKALARRFEGRHRPVRVRTFLPGEQRDATVATTPDWSHLASGPSLWFVHGTFSTSVGGFGALDDDTLGALHHAYEGRVVAYDHHTLHLAPDENAQVLAGLVPESLRLDADVVAHSRGGLVARALAGEGLDDGQRSPLRVRRAVTVATPHHGTALADPEHLVVFLDRVTTLLNLAPDVLVVADAFATVLDVVKVVLAKGMPALPGLAAMDPDGPSLRKLNSSGTDTGMVLHAICADHDPQGPLRSQLLARAADEVVDRVFGDLPNDAVVPTAGTWQGSTGPLFPVPDDRRLVLDRAAGVNHSTYFRHPEVRAALRRWLT